MDIQTAKLELVRRILELDNTEIVNKLFQTLNQEKSDFWLDLTESQKEEVELGLKQVEEGKTEDWDDFLIRLH